MGETTKISWTDHTFNPWIGCSKVSPGCQHCYAEADQADRRGRVVWGLAGTRSVTSEDNWRKPLAWNRAAYNAGVRRRVFCASLADVFEDWHGPIENSRKVQIWKRGDGSWTTSDHYRDTVALTMNDMRHSLFRLIEQTPHLDWLLLTKRPENVVRMLPNDKWLLDNKNTALGVTMENQEWANKRYPVLMQIMANVRFVSAEPLLGPIDFSEIPLMGERFTFSPRYISQIIVGGESGPLARDCGVVPIRSIVEQCRSAGVPCFVKQDSGPRSGMQGRLTDELWSVKEFPATA